MPWRHPIIFYFNDLVFISVLTQRSSTWRPVNHFRLARYLGKPYRPHPTSLYTWCSKGNLLNVAWIWLEDVSEFTRGYIFWKNMIYDYFFWISHTCVCLFIYFYIIWFMPVAVWAHSCRTFQSLQSPMSSVGTQGCFHWISVGGLDDAEWSLMFPPDLGDIKFYKYEIWII